jgi:hypothetical protein
VRVTAKATPPHTTARMSAPPTSSLVRPAFFSEDSTLVTATAVASCFTLAAYWAANSENSGHCRTGLRSPVSMFMTPCVLDTSPATSMRTSSRPEKGPWSSPSFTTIQRCESFSVTCAKSEPRSTMADGAAPAA